MSTRGDIAEAGLSSAVCEAVNTAASALDITGGRALRVLLHAGMSAYWPQVKSSPDKQVRAYEATVESLRKRWDDQPECVPHPETCALFRAMDADVAAFLRLCADRSGTQWLEPVEAIAAYVVSVLQGSVLRWLADCDDETLLVVLDDLVTGLTTRAVDA